MRRNVFICEGTDCGAVLINADDGFVILGAIKNTDTAGESKVLIAAGAIDSPVPETSLCKECLAKALGLHLAG